MLLLARGPAQSTKPLSRRAQKGWECSSAPSRGSVLVPLQQSWRWGANSPVLRGKAGPHEQLCWWDPRPQCAGQCKALGGTYAPPQSRESPESGIKALTRENCPFS